MEQENLPKSLSYNQILIMALTAGICAANIFYSQPIFHDIATTFQINPESVGIFAILSQVGYGLGLFFITPLGDKMDRKTLIVCLEACLALSLLTITLTTSVLVLYIAAFLIGLFAVAAQVILPMAASMVSENRGKVVGIVFTGILIGVLVSRIFSGYITQWFGWRYIYGFSSILVTISAIMIHTSFLKSKEEPFKGTYMSLLASTFQQFTRFKSLRRTSLIGALTFGTFSSFWIVLTFHLGGEPFNFKSDTIGLFGILAIAGILLVPIFGKMADKNASPSSSLTIGVVAALIGVLALIINPYSLVTIWIAIVLIDVGVQIAQVTNIAFIYTLDQSANSRINTVYMTSYFVGGSLGATFGILCWKIGGWYLVMGQMALCLCTAFLIIRFSVKTSKSIFKFIKGTRGH
ncbi:MFS transporter [Arenibacter algicola]|uniref:Putative transporter n=1 Tax=Arenibacter algicola TaxID=616991 RepID=A0A221V1E2_9FLAO|nr:MFS transporter [Arenibacter algicola]ASO07414.1 putative transporter [Arenibacter algicola]